MVSKFDFISSKYRAIEHPKKKKKKAHDASQQETRQTCLSMTGRIEKSQGPLTKAEQEVDHFGSKQPFRGIRKAKLSFCFFVFAYVIKCGWHLSPSKG